MSPDLYKFAVEDFAANLDELLPLYSAHYREMQERLAGQGILVPEMAPRYDEYLKASNGGYLFNIVARTVRGEPVGYVNVYITNDMHNGELIAQEDALYVRKDHRNGVGKKLVQFGLEFLRGRGVKRLIVQALTDLRVSKLWGRMGFKPVATCMIYRFDQEDKA